MTKCFVDTSILVYAKDNRNLTKQATAGIWIERLIAHNALVLSAQSLREFYNVRRRQDPTQAGRTTARADVGRLARFVPSTLSSDFLEVAWTLEDRYRLHIFDALLLAAALAARCTIFLSEDLQAGQKLGALTILNPFITAPEALFGP